MATKKKRKTKRKTASKKRSAPRKRKKKVDSDMQFVGIVALIAAVAAFYWKGPDALFWYLVPAAVGVALLYEAYK